MGRTFQGVPLAALCLSLQGGSQGHPCSSLLLQHPWFTPAAFPARCVSLSAACACSPLSRLSSPLSPLLSLLSPCLLPYTSHSHQGCAQKLRSPHLCFWTCPCIQVTVGSPPPMWAMGRARGAHPAAVSCFLPPRGMRGEARSPGDALQARQRDWGTGKVTRRVPGCPEVQVGAQKHLWRAPGSRKGCLENSGLTEIFQEFPEVLQGPGRAPGCKGRQKENLGVQ